MSYVVWTCLGPIFSHSCSQFWKSFETLPVAKKYAEASWCLLDNRIPEVEEDVRMPAGRSGWVDEYPKSDSDYESMGDLPPVGALLALHKYFTVGGGQWGHTPHWLSAGIAAIADGDEERAKKCLAIAFGYKDAVRGEERRNALFATSRLLEPSDFAAGRPLNPITSLWPYKE